jgi:hypothetical protein
MMSPSQGMPAKTVTQPAQTAPAIPEKKMAESTPAPAATQSPKPASDKSSTLSKGSYFRLGWMNPTNKYMTGNAQSGFDAQIGTQFYIGPVIANCLRFGLETTWFDCAYAKLDVKDGHSAVISALGVGPLVSVAPAKDFAISTYAKALPSFDVSVGEEILTDPIGLTQTTETVGRGGFSVNGVWGIQMRYSSFELGYEFNWGTSKVKEVGSKTAFDIGTKNYDVNNSRVYLGIRF